MNIINEDKRIQILAKSKKGRADNYAPPDQKSNRDKRRFECEYRRSVKELNNIDMDKLFTEDILDINVQVRGSSGNIYIVKIKFSGFLEALNEELTKRNLIKISHLAVAKALTKCLSSEDIFVHCSCPDWKFRFAFWATMNGTNAVAGEQTSNGKKKANPNDTKGGACKHVLAILHNLSWVQPLASTITNYVNYMELHYKKSFANVIYPAIFKQDYSEDTTNVVDDERPKDLINIANQDAVERSRFKKGNKMGIRFISNKEAEEMDKLENQVDTDNVLPEDETKEEE